MRPSSDHGKPHHSGTRVGDNALQRNPLRREGVAVPELGREHAPWRAASAGRWILLYSCFLAYTSTLIGPGGVHFVPISLTEAWSRFLGLDYLRPGDLVWQDAVANGLALVPIGFLSIALWWSRAKPRARPALLILTILCNLTLILSLKFLQLYFPPRTVALDYIVAQGLGSGLGVGAFLCWRVLFPRREAADRRVLSAALVAYALGLLGFLLFPFDFVLNPAQLRQRLAELPYLLFATPGEGRPLLSRVLVCGLYAAETLPLGMLLALQWPRHRLRNCVLGLVAIGGFALLQVLLLHGNPSVVAALCRGAGIVGGVLVINAVNQLSLIRWRLQLARAVPWLVTLYVLVLFLSNDLVRFNWRTPEEALLALDWRGLWPFWHAYIVSKTQAFSSLVGHLLMYMPIGIFVWLRRGTRADSAVLAVSTAVALSALVEIGRWFSPGLQPDITNILIAGLAARCAIPAAEMFWHTLSGSFRDPALPPAAAIFPRSTPKLSRRVSAQGRSSPLTALRLGLALGCLGAIAVALYFYPLSPWPLATALAGYAVVVWRWPIAWLIVIPALLPTLDLAPWTGWFYIGEPDLFILATVGVLLLRWWPGWGEFSIGRTAALAIMLSCGVYLVSIAAGFLAVPPSETANPYLSAWNAWRLSKGFLSALVLFPFLACQLRRDRTALFCLGGGFVAGLALVVIAALLERLAFPGLLDFTTDYRIVATFSDMHLGGGLIGAYLAMAIPFLLVFITAHWWVALLGSVLAVLASYALVVTYARSAYVVAIIGVFSTSFALSAAALKRRNIQSAAIGFAVTGTVLVLLLGAAAEQSPIMHSRLTTIAPDLSLREQNWEQGLAVRSSTLSTFLLGEGLGTFPRLFRQRAAALYRGTDFVLSHDESSNWLAITAGAPGFYFGQKVAAHIRGEYVLQFAMRSAKPLSLDVVLCEKLLLYSDNCTVAVLTKSVPGQWVEQKIVLRVEQLSSPMLFGWLRRPVELAFRLPNAGDTVEIRAVRLFDLDHHQLIANGDFTSGTDRWFFTDDEHLVWRMKNQYLMLFFEQGSLGVLCYLLLCATALIQVWRACRAGYWAAAPIAGAIVSFSAAGLFDYLLGSPRLGFLFYLLCFAGLVLRPRDPLERQVEHHVGTAVPAGRPEMISREARSTTRAAAR